MIIASLLGGVTGAVAFVLAGLWCGVGPVGLLALYVLGGSVCLGFTVLVAMQLQDRVPSGSMSR